MRLPKLEWLCVIEMFVIYHRMYKQFTMPDKIFINNTYIDKAMK